MSSIKVKEKKCKGSAKAFGFEACGKMTLYRNYGLCSSCYSSWLRNTPEGIEKVVKMTIKVSKTRTDLEVLEKEEKENRSLSYLLTNTKNACHEYIRERDKGKECVSCGCVWNSDFQAGHWKKAELFSSLKFNENNIFGQCRRCNLFEDGNVQIYGTRIHFRIGVDGKEEIERLAILDKKINFKWDRQTLIETRNYYKQKLKELKQ